MFPGLGRLLPQAVGRMYRRGRRVSAATNMTDAVTHSAPTAAGREPPVAVVVRQVPYGERPARNRQLTLLAELLGAEWRRELPVRFGVAVSDITRRQAAAAIRQLTGGVRPSHIARGTWHRVAVDPDWIDRPRGARRQVSGATASFAATPVAASATADVLPIQVKALRAARRPPGAGRPDRRAGALRLRPPSAGPAHRSRLDRGAHPAGAGGTGGRCAALSARIREGPGEGRRPRGWCRLRGPGPRGRFATRARTGGTRNGMWTSASAVGRSGSSCCVARTPRH